MTPEPSESNFEIYQGAQPPGALFYQINCGPQIPVGQPICLSGTGPHTLTFCKPGSNTNRYRITSIQGYTQGVDVTTMEGCQTQLQVSSLVTNTITWNDITGNGFYENYLSCTSGCSTVTFSTQPGFPSYVDFEVCGQVYTGICQNLSQTVCDTVRVNIEPKINISLASDSATFCHDDSFRLVVADITPKKASHIFSWKDGANGSGNTAGTDTFFYVPVQGDYSLVVVDADFANCSADTVNVPVIMIPPPPVVIVPDDTTICSGENILLTVSGAVSYLWSQPPSVPCDTCASILVSPASNSTYNVSGTDSKGCTASDAVTIALINPVYRNLNFSICEGDSVTIGSSVYGNAGTYYDTFSSASGCDSIVVSTISVRYSSYTFLDTVICTGTSIIVGSSTYSAAGVYYDTLTAGNGCDSIVETNLAVHPVGICENPDLATCPQRIILVLDESGSVAGNETGGAVNINAQVRAAATDFVNSLVGAGPEIAVVEFNSTARTARIGGITGYQAVDANYVTGFTVYISQDGNASGSQTNYDPEDYGCLVPQACYANWEDAFDEVYSINSSQGVADLVIFFTDGQPNAYINPLGNVTVGTSAAVLNQALMEATAKANAVQIQGSHVFVIGLQNPILPESKVQQVSGMERYPDQQQNFYKSDYTLSSAVQLQSLMGSIGLLICHADLRLEKSVNNPVTCAGSTVVFTLIATNDGTDDATGVQVHDYFPTGYTYVSDDGGALTTLTGNIIKWNIGSLSNGESDTLRITAIVNASGDYKNVAEIISSSKEDGDSTPDNDDGDQSEDDEDAASVTLINCDDGNLCTTDVCAGGGCSHTYIPATCSIAGDNTICSGEITQFIALGGAAYLWSGPGGFSGNNANTGSISNAGVYSVTVTDANGCTSSCSIMLIVHTVPSCSISGDNVICPGESASFTATGGTVFSWTGPNGYATNTATASPLSASGNYTVTVTNANGCASSCVITLNQLPDTYTTVNEAVCFGQSYVMAAAVYSSAGTYRDTFVSSNGCDSIVTLNLSIIPRLYGPYDFLICQGDSVGVGNSVYQNAGTYYDTLISSLGCDSIVISSVTVANPSFTLIDTALCSGQSIDVGISTYATTGIYFDTLQNSNGCDSIVQTNFQVLPLSYTFLTPVICSVENFAVGSSVYTATGTYYDTLVAANGCDSLIQTDLMVLPVFTTALTTSICEGQTFLFGNDTLSVSGNYSDTLTSNVGCDSILNLSLNVIPRVYGPFNYTLCQGDSLVVGTSVYKISGTFNDTFTSSTGCDSIVISTIQVLNHSRTIYNSTTCAGESLIVGSSTYNSTGVYFDTLPAANGCDSIVQTNLLVLPTINVNADTAICAGESFSAGSSFYTSSGVYLDTLTSSFGCDSVIQINLQVFPVFISVIDTSICEGETISFGSTVYGFAGSYSDTAASFAGCDSILILNLQVLPRVYGPFNYSLCQGDSLIVGTSVYKNSGTFNDTFVSSIGCDSIVISTIQVLNHSQTIYNSTICSGESIIVASSSYNTTGVYFDTLAAANGCDSVVQTNPFGASDQRHDY